MSMRISSCNEYFETLDKRFVPSAAKGVHAVIQFELEGDGGGTWHIDIHDSAMKVVKGSNPNPTATVGANAGDYVKIINGDMSGLRAVMTRKMKVSGNLVLARKMENMFPPAKS